MDCTCSFCGRKFYKPICRIKEKRGKYCSRKCRNLSGTYVPGGYKKTCKTCGKEFKDFPSNKTVNCSRECSRIYFGQLFCGSKSVAWRGGLTQHTKQIRRGLDYREWHRAVLVRDNFTCQACGKRGGKLQVDHIKPIALYPDLRLDLSNGQALCPLCHQKKTSIDMKIIKTNK